MFAYSSRIVAMTVISMAAALTAVCGITAVHAQDGAPNEINDRLRACDGIGDTMEKLACFDAVVKGLDDASPAPVVEASTTSDATAKSTDAEAKAKANPSGSEAVADAVSADAPTAAASAAAIVAIAAEQPVEAQPVAAEAASPVSSSVEQTADITASAEERFGFSAAELEENQKVAEMPEEAAREPELDSIQATIVRSWATPDSRFEALLDNGQVWRETPKTRRMRLPMEGSTVVITKGRLGSFKMKIGNDNRFSGVRRTK